MDKKYSALSDKAILKFIDTNEITITPFNLRNLNTSSYDVTLGEYYFRETQRKPESIHIYNMYSKSDVARIWGEPKQAKPCSEYKFYLENIKSEDKIILIEPGETILAHTNEFIGGNTHITTMMKSRSSLGRNFIECCKCVSGDSLVSMGNGLSMKIEDIFSKYNHSGITESTDDMIISVNPHNCIKTLTWGNRVRTKLVNGKHIRENSINDIVSSGKTSHIIKRGTKKVCKIITLLDGRKMKVTDDHKVLVDNGNTKQWIETRNLTLDMKLVCNANETVADMYDNDEIGYIISFNELNIKWDITVDRNKILSFSRLCGLLVADGYLTDKLTGQFYVGDMEDVNQVINDIKVICNEEVNYHGRDDAYTVEFDTSLGKLFNNIGCISGNKTYNSISVPEFIRDPNCPKSVFREFFAGMWGGNGTKPSFNRSKGFNAIKSMWISTRIRDGNILLDKNAADSENTVDSLIAYLNDKFDISMTRITRYYSNTDNTRRTDKKTDKKTGKKTDEKYRVLYTWRNTILLTLKINFLTGNTAVYSNIDNIIIKWNCVASNGLFPKFTKSNFTLALKSLCNKGYIIKNGDLYCLSTKGIQTQIRFPSTQKVTQRTGLKFNTYQDALKFYSKIGLRYCLKKNIKWSIWSSWFKYTEMIGFEWWKTTNAACDLFYEHNDIEDPRHWRQNLTNVPWEYLKTGFIPKNRVLAAHCYNHVRSQYSTNSLVNEIFMSQKKFVNKWATKNAMCFPETYNNCRKRSNIRSFLDYVDESSFEMDDKTRETSRHYSLPIININSISEPIDVYDISVPDTSSFICNNMVVHNCAGWGDVGYTSRWTLEITNNSKHYTIPLVVGRRIAQIIFFDVGEINGTNYIKNGKYQTVADIETLKSKWEPSSMLPKMYKDFETKHKHDFDIRIIGC